MAKESHEHLENHIMSECQYPEPFVGHNIIQCSITITLKAVLVKPLQRYSDPTLSKTIGFVQEIQ